MDNMTHDIRTYRRSPRKLVRILGVGMVGVLFAILFSLLFGFVVMKLWNWLMPDIFGLKEISYLQAFGITILAKILFSGIHGPHPKADHIHRKVDRRWHRLMGIGDVDNPWNAECSHSCDEFSHEDMKHYRISGTRRAGRHSENIWPDRNTTEIMITVEGRIDLPVRRPCMRKIKPRIPKGGAIEGSIK